MDGIKTHGHETKVLLEMGGEDLSLQSLVTVTQCQADADTVCKDEVDDRHARVARIQQRLMRPKLIDTHQRGNSDGPSGDRLASRSLGGQCAEAVRQTGECRYASKKHCDRGDKGADQRLAAALISSPFDQGSTRALVASRPAATVAADTGGAELPH